MIDIKNEVTAVAMTFQRQAELADDRYCRGEITWNELREIVNDLLRVYLDKLARLIVRELTRIAVAKAIEKLPCA